MKELAQLLRDLREAGAILNAALFGAVAQMRYTEAETAELDGVPMRVVSAAHLAAIALELGRAKDHDRMVALLQAGATTEERVREIAARYGLAARGDAFRARFLEGK